ncbi:hypothetical protein P8452_27978 [Trifolium repens]|nr:hypothetical protein P8452_27978 [Trifolium repens]
MNLPRFTSKSLVSTSHNSHSLSRLNFVNSILITHSLSLSRVLRQFHFDSHSLSCSTCSVEFTLGNVEDEKSHAQFHKGFTQGIQFRGLILLIRVVELFWCWILINLLIEIRFKKLRR